MADASKRVVFGISNVHYAVWDSETSAYGECKAIPGAVSLSISVEGDTSTFYADNGPYAVFSSNGGYTGELAVAVLEDDALVDLLGYKKDSNGLVVEDVKAVAPSFALTYEVSSNEKEQRFVFYNCTATRPEYEANTRSDSTDPDTQTLSLTMGARTFTDDNGNSVDAVKSSLVRDDKTSTVKAAWDAWHTTVQKPSFPKSV